MSSANISPRQTKIVNLPSPGQRICAELRHRGKNYRQKHRPWGQPCGPLRQLFHNCEFAFFVVLFSLAFFKFFFFQEHKLVNEKLLSNSSIAQLRFDM